MKKFETPEIKLLTFAVEDIVTTSTGNMLPWVPASEDLDAAAIVKE